MSSYSQTGEDTIIIQYFKQFKGTLLDMGANDGRTFSNSLRLIQKGWQATLVEASKKSFDSCVLEHKGNSDVDVVNIGVAENNGTLVFHESGEHIGNGDHSLVSTFDKRELPRFEKNTTFVKTEIDVVDYPTLLGMSKYKSFDFITMDIEGMETVVLPQMDLTDVQCICIEYNSKNDLLRYYKDYCSKFGLKELHRNAENLIMAR